MPVLKSVSSKCLWVFASAHIMGDDNSSEVPVKAFLVALVLLGTVSATAAVQNEGLTVQTKLTYKGKSKEIVVSKEVMIERGNSGWIPLTDVEDQVALLGRIAQTDGTYVKVEYVLVDGNQRPSSIVSTPSILAKLDEAAQISVGGKNQTPKFSITLTARRTIFMADEPVIQNSQE